MIEHTTAEAQLLDRLDQMRGLLIEAQKYVRCFGSLSAGNLSKRIDAVLAQDAPKEER